MTKTTSFFYFLFVALLFLSVLCLNGCAAKTAHPLLEMDTASMNDAALLRHYFDLDSAIASCEGSSAGDTTVSVGTGGGSGGAWGGISIGKIVGGGCDSSALRERKVDVRLQLRDRDLEP